MRKLAIFAEGYTEAVFAEKLVQEIADENHVAIERREIRGGASTPRRLRLITARKEHPDQRYFVLVYDCGGDDLVKSRILEEHENLTKATYERIIGIRDVRPKYAYADIPKLEAWLPKYIKTKLIPVQFILGVMEIEAWFLAEHHHFPRIHASITVQAIAAALGFDPVNDDMALRAAPADDLNACYTLAGKTYEKGRADETVNALDYAHLYLDLRNKIPYLDRLARSLDDFLSN
jgi:hypothetical protein